MPNKMERFTQRARRVLSLAQEEAETLNHNIIGTEHLLIALIREEGGLAGQVLGELGLEQYRVRELIEGITHAAQRTNKQAIDLSDGTKRVLELGVDEARKLGHQYIGTEHLLLALLSQTDDIAIDVLKRCGVSPDEVRRRTLQILQEAPVQVTQMERFTQRARRALSLAQDAAEQLKHNSIGTEHLLLGLFREEGGVAGRVLRDLGLEQSRVEEAIKQLTQVEERKPNQALDLSPGTKRVLELSVDEARRMGHHYIGTEHLLLALVRQSEGVAIDILKRYGVSPVEVRRQTRKILQESPVQTAHPPEPQAEPKPQIPSLEPLRRQNFPRLPQAVLSQSFLILQATITRVLDMVGANKLTSAQAAEVLAGLQPYLTPSTSEAALLIAQSLGATLPQDRMLRVVVRDSVSGTVKLEVALPLIETLESLDGLVSAAASDYVGWLWTTDMDDKNRIEVRVEAQKDDEPPPVEGNDAE